MRRKRHSSALTKAAKLRRQAERIENQLMPTDERPQPGRPSLWSQELEDKLFSRLAKGRTLKAICRDDADMPNIITIMHWQRSDDKFLERMLLVRKLQAHGFVDDTLEISDEARENQDALAKARMRIQVRQWMAERFNRESYGQQTNHQVSGPNGGAIKFESKDEIIARIVSMAPAVAAQQNVIEGEVIKEKP